MQWRISSCDDSSTTCGVDVAAKVNIEKSIYRGRTEQIKDEGKAEYL